MGTSCGDGTRKSEPILPIIELDQNLIVILEIAKFESESDTGCSALEIDRYRI